MRRSCSPGTLRAMLQTATPDLDDVTAPEVECARPIHVAGCAARSERGHRREVNEDGVLLAGDLLAVADGVGGQLAGEEASAVALAELRRLVGRDPRDPVDSLLRAFGAANARVRAAASAPAFSQMATTMVAALVCDSQVIVAHAGDSRAYLLREASFEQLTVDHSLVATLVARGLIDARGARRHPMRSVIVRAVGLEETVSPDVLSCPVRRGDVLMLCTDGLTDALDAEEVEAVLRRTPTLDGAVERLALAARERGSGDDVSIVAAVLG